MEYTKQNRNPLTFAILIVCVFLLTTETFASEFDPVTRRDYAFSAQIRRAIENDNREWLANQIAFPLLYGSAKHPKHARTKKEFFQHFDDIITPDVKTMIARYAAEDDIDLFKNSVGMMLARGTIWFIETYDAKEPEKIKYVIITVNSDTINLP